MPKFKKIRRLVWKALDEYQHRRSLNYLDDEDCDPTCRHDAGVKQEVFARQEMEELNNWARLGFQLHFGWFTLLLAINGIATGWLFRSKDYIRSFVPLVCLMFMVLNLMGTVATILIGKYMIECDRRIQSLIEKLTYETEALYSNAQSPIPRQAVKILFGFTAFTLMVVLVFWTILFGTL